MASTLLNLFADRAAANLNAIERAIAERDHAALVKIAHTLKGVAGNLSAHTLQNVTAKIDHDYRNANYDEMSLLSDVTAMRHEVLRCLDAVPSLHRLLQGQVT